MVNMTRRPLVLFGFVFVGGLALYLLGLVYLVVNGSFALSLGGVLRFLLALAAIAGALYLGLLVHGWLRAFFRWRHNRRSRPT